MTEETQLEVPFVQELVAHAWMTLGMSGNGQARGMAGNGRDNARTTSRLALYTRRVHRDAIVTVARLAIRTGTGTRAISDITRSTTAFHDSHTWIRGDNDERRGQRLNGKARLREGNEKD